MLRPPNVSSFLPLLRFKLIGAAGRCEFRRTRKRAAVRNEWMLHLRSSRIIFKFQLETLMKLSDGNKDFFMLQLLLL